MNKKRVRAYTWKLLALAVLAIVVLIVGVAGAYSTRLVPDVVYPCPPDMKCYVYTIDGTLIKGGE